MSLKPNSIKKILILIAVIFTTIVAAMIIKAATGHTYNDTGKSIYTVESSDMLISVVESGTVEARHAEVIKSQVEGRATIINIVPEGTFITQEDVNNGKILVELDSSQIKDKLTKQEITYNTALANFTEAKESLEIQKNQNDSDIQVGKINLKFARMDLEKYLGDKIAAKLINAKANDANIIDNIAALVHDPALGGEALQKLRELKAKIDLADEELKRAQNNLEWTQKLYDKKYVAKTELEADKLKAQRLQIELDQSKTSLDLFLKYEFVKEAERLLSDYGEFQRELQRILARTRSRMAQAESKLKSNKATLELQREQLEKYKQQLEACIIKAPSTGMVVYYSENRRWGGSRTQIELGAEVRERQEIITLPNAAEMSVDVKVHESWIEKVQLGQKARVTIDARPDEVFTGVVSKISPLPDPQSWIGNPDLKVYTTKIDIKDKLDFIKPGMSAKVEIIISQLENVIKVPIQAVANRGGKKVCFIPGSGKPKPLQVKTGQFNDSFVQITEGLKQGQKIMLNPPRLFEIDKERKEQKTRKRKPKA